MDRTGLYGLFDLDGAPPDPQAAAALGFAPGRLDTPLAAAIDLADPDAATCAHSDGALTLFLGRLDEPAAIAEWLGLAVGTSHAALADAAFARCGPDIRTRLHGEWTFARWDGHALVLIASIAQRDPLLYAIRGGRIAIGPDLRHLSRIAWVDAAFDPAGLLMAMGLSTLRAPGDARTPIIGIAALSPGACLTIDRHGIRRAPPAMIEIDPDWRGTLDTAMAEAEALMQRIVRQRMVGGAYACMVSGGLDSATLAWLTAKALVHGERLRFLTSAAQPGTRQIDEMAEAAIIATHLGIPHDPVVAGALPGPYRADPRLFRDANGPTLSVRHYLYHRFAAQTRAHDAAILFDGQFGELIFSNSLPLRARSAWWRNARRLLTRRPAPAEAFHVHLAPHLLDALPEPLREALHHSHQPMRLPAVEDRWGISSGFSKAMRASASLDLGRVRVAMPFRDPRLVALFAGFPAAMLYPKPGERTPARHLLIGKVPDTIRLRGKGPGFAPDYVDRLRSEAEAARERIALFRRAGADEWLDLDALDSGLARAAQGAAGNYDNATRTQLTALAGEFIAWWRGFS